MRIAPFLATLCVILAAAASADARPRRHAHGHGPAAVAGAVVSTTITHAGASVVLTATIRNGMSVPICAMPTYGAGARVTATRRGRALRNLEVHAMAPLAPAAAHASCLRLNPTDVTRVTYRLERMFRDPLVGARVCYSFPYRRIDQQQVRQGSGCATG